ncbi:DUF5330 domain-containing protein [Rhizobium sp. SSA_523]|uniref:DUF5330 domain-containing protein n=1 Tax=Rhizobium sp. SSA_523 TaxID=2952477 RepID=UPI00209136A8|nr:DUF5330 domain-containing protein [Rhizobium sp. SSA_523]MCO5730957.1 DUF5330 domain-containing protein [Rhizobium sp. SSA_523]WKC24234.1 DUF5330 domain-containing protein [Rhizobium sp. SSA_523]
MWFLIKTTLVFGAGLVALSYFSQAPQATAEGEAHPLQLTDALSAAAGAYSYVSGLCAEKPDVCETGAETFTALAIRAREGARVAYDFLDTQFPSSATSSGAASENGAARQPAPAASLAQDRMAVPKITVVSAADAPATLQPFPPKPSQARVTGAIAAADGVVTGTVPLPSPRPDTR